MFTTVLAETRIALRSLTRQPGFLLVAVFTLALGVGAADPQVLAAVIGVLLLIAIAACVLPAQRATRIAPMIALRDQ